MTDFHGRMMNIQSDGPLLFREGAKSARAVAAEIALEADAEIARLRAALAWYADLPQAWEIKCAGMAYGDLRLLGEKARAALDPKP